MIAELYDKIHQTKNEMEKRNYNDGGSAIVCLTYQELAFIEQVCQTSLLIKQLMEVKK